MGRKELDPKTAAEMGSKGGNARTLKLSRARRGEIATKAAQARWAKEKKA